MITKYFWYTGHKILIKRPPWYYDAGNYRLTDKIQKIQTRVMWSIIVSLLVIGIMLMIKKYGGIF